ncbi:hypothetical protein CDL12_03430 [Handroanthus impetiginosus]|uniref:Uncharacterized protein n=1 Tax=Handroanthus impetiginosus TaxID=429701 RepID=A0A2G9I2L7_9LAMI|nr:hypothetical protein CDL12_03430 [Handroanthus impetiginosus]
MSSFAFVQHWAAMSQEQLLTLEEEENCSKWRRNGFQVDYHHYLKALNRHANPIISAWIIFLVYFF